MHPSRQRGPLPLVFLFPPFRVLARHHHHFACVMTFLCSRVFSWVMIPQSHDFAAVLCREKSELILELGARSSAQSMYVRTYGKCLSGIRITQKRAIVTQAISIHTCNNVATVANGGGIQYEQGPAS